MLESSPRLLDTDFHTIAVVINCKIARQDPTILEFPLAFIQCRSKRTIPVDVKPVALGTELAT